MCDPASIIGGVLSMASSFAQMSMQQAQVDAQNAANNEAYRLSKQAREAEIVRQQAFEQQARESWEETSGTMGADAAAAEQDTAKTEFLEDFDKRPGVLDGELLSGQENGNEIIKTEIANRTNKAAADARRRVQALAALTAYGSTDQTRSTGIANGANSLMVLNGLRRGSLGVSQQEQNISPAQVGSGSSFLPDILSGAGGIVSSYGGGGTTSTVAAPTASNSRVY